MENLYPTFWSIILWCGAGVFAFFTLLGISPLGKGLPQRVQGIVAFFLISVVLASFGFSAMGDRQLRDAERQAGRAWADYEQARADYEDLAQAMGPKGGVVQPMSFQACLRRIRELSVVAGAPENIVETTQTRVVRFGMSDGSVLVTCSGREGRMVMTRSDRR